MDPLLEWLADGVRNGLTGDDWHRRVTAVALRLGTRLKATVPLGGGERHWHEVLVTSAGGPPLVIALCVWRQDAGIAGPDLKDKAARLRGGHPGARLALMLIAVDGAGEPQVDLAALTAAAVPAYERVVFGLVGAGDRWWSAGDPVGELAGFDAAIDLLTAGPAPEPAPAPAVPAPAPAAPAPARTKVLLVSGEWKSTKGGLSTFNREFAIALARSGLDVKVALPEFGADDLADAKEKGVALVAPAPVPGLTAEQLQTTRPVVADPAYRPDVIVGHGRHFGPYALVLKNMFYPGALRLHVVHTDAERLEGAREVAGGRPRTVIADERGEIDIALAASATLSAGVGPLLTRMIGRRTRGRGAVPKPFMLVPGLREGDEVDPANWPDERHVLIVARAEDVEIKGIDLAIRALRKVAGRLPGNRPDERLRLIIRGEPRDQTAKEHDRLKKLAGDGLEVTFRGYSWREQDLRDDLFQSRVVIMPSRAEGFGLAAYEAIAAGVPVLLSQDSGLAELLTDLVRDEEDPQPREVVVGAGDEEKERAWADALHRVLLRPKESFARAAELRTTLRAQVSWEKTIADLLEALGLPRSGRH